MLLQYSVFVCVKLSAFIQWFISHSWRLNSESRDQEDDEESSRWRWRFCWENKKALKDNEKEEEEQRKLTLSEKH